MCVERDGVRPHPCAISLKSHMIQKCITSQLLPLVIIECCDIENTQKVNKTVTSDTKVRKLPITDTNLSTSVSFNQSEHGSKTSCKHQRFSGLDWWIMSTCMSASWPHMETNCLRNWKIKNKICDQWWNQSCSSTQVMVLLIRNCTQMTPQTVH